MESIYEGLQLFSRLENAAPLTFDINSSTVCHIMAQDDMASMSSLQITVNGIPLVGNDYHASNSSVVLPITGVLQPVISRCDIINVSTINVCKPQTISYRSNIVTITGNMSQLCSATNMSYRLCFSSGRLLHQYIM